MIYTKTKQSEKLTVTKYFTLGVPGNNYFILTGSYIIK